MGRVLLVHGSNHAFSGPEQMAREWVPATIGARADNPVPAARRSSGLRTKQRGLLGHVGPGRPRSGGRLVREGRELTTWVIHCPHCAKLHTHGGDPGHRVSHCFRAPRNNGYFLTEGTEET
jgi:hypothetical protein